MNNHDPIAYVLLNVAFLVTVLAACMVNLRQSTQNSPDVLEIQESSNEGVVKRNKFTSMFHWINILCTLAVHAFVIFVYTGVNGTFTYSVLDFRFSWIVVFMAICQLNQVPMIILKIVKVAIEDLPDPYAIVLNGPVKFKYVNKPDGWCQCYNSDKGFEKVIFHTSMICYESLLVAAAVFMGTEPYGGYHGYGSDSGTLCLLVSAILLLLTALMVWVSSFGSESGSWKLERIESLLRTYGKEFLNNESLDVIAVAQQKPKTLKFPGISPFMLNTDARSAIFRKALGDGDASGYPKGATRVRTTDQSHEKLYIIPADKAALIDSLCPTAEFTKIPHEASGELVKLREADSRMDSTTSANNSALPNLHFIDAQTDFQEGSNHCFFYNYSNASSNALLFTTKVCGLGYGSGIWVNFPKSMTIGFIFFMLPFLIYFLFSTTHALMVFAIVVITPAIIARIGRFKQFWELFTLSFLIGWTAILCGVDYIAPSNSLYVSNLTIWQNLDIGTYPYAVINGSGSDPTLNLSTSTTYITLSCISLIVSIFCFLAQASETAKTCKTSKPGKASEASSKGEKYRSIQRPTVRHRVAASIRSSRSTQAST